MGGMGGAGGGMAGSGGSGGMQPTCGDGVVNTGAESCDDGNMTAGDGCSPSCLTEPGTNCPGNPVTLGATPIVLSGDMANQLDMRKVTCEPYTMNEAVYAVTPTESGTMTVQFAAMGNNNLSIRSDCPSLLPPEAAEITCSTVMGGDVTQSIWVHKGQTYYVIAQGDDKPYTLTLTLTRCGDNVKQGMEQCDDATLACVGCLLCNGAGEFMDPATKHCYRLVATNRDWQAARNDCVAWGGDLAGIRDKAEFDFLEKSMSPQIAADTWVGGYPIQNTCSFAWVNGEPWYIQWVTGQPNSNMSGQCIEYYMSNAAGERALSDLTCTTGRHYLCERAPAGFCGDGIIQPGEQCDGNASIPGGNCTAKCKRAFPCNGAGEFKDMATNHCYKVETAGKDWLNAKWSCDAWGGYLAVIESTGENSLIQSHLSARSWIGGWEGAFNDKTIVWETSVSGCGYENWTGGEPNSTGDDCVALDDGNGGWYDESCAGTFDYVCEKGL